MTARGTSAGRRRAGGALVLLVAGWLAGCGPEPAPADPVDETPTAPVDRYADRGAEETLPGRDPALVAPHLARGQAPETFRAVFETSKGEVEVECVRSWSPRGVDRFYNLVRIGFYRKTPVHQVVEGSYLTFGIHPHSRVVKAWTKATILDEPAVQSNRRGYLCFLAREGRSNSRSTELVIHLADNPHLDSLSAPIGRVVRGMRVVEQLKGGDATTDAAVLRGQGSALLVLSGEVDTILDAKLVE